MPQLGHNECARCRANKAADKMLPNCEDPEKDFRCWATNLPADSSEAPMAVDGRINWLSTVYIQIVRIADGEQFEFTRAKKRIMFRLPSMTGLKTWMDTYDAWNCAPFSKTEFVRLIGIYHENYRRALIDAYTSG